MCLNRSPLRACACIAGIARLAQTVTAYVCVCVCACVVSKSRPTTRPTTRTPASRARRAPQMFRLVHHEDIPTLTASDWSIVRIYPRFL
eukprot:765752-Prorocentrum_minimum.AAC.1